MTIDIHNQDKLNKRRQRVRYSPSSKQSSKFYYKIDWYGIESLFFYLFPANSKYDTKGSSKEEEKTTVIIIVIVVGVLIGIVIAAIISFCCHKNSKQINFFYLKKKQVEKIDTSEG